MFPFLTAIIINNNNNTVLALVEDGRVYTLALRFVVTLLLNNKIFLNSFVMDKRMVYKGCGKDVVNPVTCDDCGIASHPSCMSRTGHPHSHGKFLSCASPNVSFGVQRSFLDEIKDLIHKELVNF